MASDGQYPVQNLAMRLVPILMAVVAIGFVIVQGCQEGPFGRPQIVGLTPQQEARLGADAFRDVLGKSDVDYDDEVVGSVKKLGERLAEATQNPDYLRAARLRPGQFDWEFRVVRSKAANAFCLPGGKVVVYTGILPICQTESGLATVLGHEIGHALAHHSAERMAQQQIVSLGQQGVAATLGDYDPHTRQRILEVLGVGSNVGFILPFSRKHESEADHLGLLLMATSGYDPREASRFWFRMQERGGERPPEFLSTHPDPARRAQALQEWLPEALTLYEKSPHHPDRRLPWPPGSARPERGAAPHR